MRLENFVTKNIAAYLVYALMALAMFVVSNLFGGQVIGLYWSVAFFAVVGMDFYKTQVVENGASEVPAYACARRAPAGAYLDQWGFVRIDYFGAPSRYPAAGDALDDDPVCNRPRSLGDNFVDRFIGNMFVAPFTLPVKLYEAFKR